MQIRINREHLIGVVCIGIGGLVLILTRTFPQGQGYVKLTGPAFFPNVLAIILILSGLYEMVVGHLQRKTLAPVLTATIKQQISVPETQKILTIMALMIVYVLSVKVVGFYTVTFLFMFLSTWTLKVRFRRRFVYSAVILFILYLIFERLFFVNLPHGFLI